ncbi:E motif [Dillenia turbinata]|uniref:E motif n=1 Tax=Dillenia turbinata TaxID=194707 RepID=A0AAN8W749_9MAGN
MNRCYSEDLHLYLTMKSSGLKTNPVTGASVLPILAELRLKKEVAVGNSLIDLYCKCGILDLGVKAFNEVREKNIVTYKTIITAYGDHGYREQAFSFFDQMKEAIIHPDTITFTALISACRHSGLIERGSFIYNSVIIDYKIKQVAKHFSCMVDLVGRAGHIDDACNFIRRLPVEPKLDVLGSLLGSCKVHKQEELSELVGRHILQKNERDSGHYILLSNILASFGRWEDAQKIRTAIHKQGLKKKPGKSWIEVGSCFHLFHARDITLAEFDNIQMMMETLNIEMKNDGCAMDSSFFYDLVDGDDDGANSFLYRSL